MIYYMHVFCTQNKQFELLEFVFNSMYVDLQDEISLMFTAGSVWCV